MRKKFLTLFLGISLLLPLAGKSQGADKVELDGFIEPFTVVKVGSGVSGIIESMDVDRGDMVKKGQILARLDSRVERATLELIRARSQVEASIEQKEARLEFAAREKKRRQELSKKGIIPDYEMDEAATNETIARHELQEVQEQRKIALLELKQAQESLERRVIRSPIDGVVVELFLAAGELVSTEPILKLAQLDPLNVEVIAPVSMLGAIRKGQRVEVKPESPINRSFQGRVKIVDRVVDAASGTFGVRIEMPNKGNGLPAGLKCRVVFSSP